MSDQGNTCIDGGMNDGEIHIQNHVEGGMSECEKVVEGGLSGDASNCQDEMESNGGTGDQQYDDGTSSQKQVVGEMSGQEFVDKDWEKPVSNTHKMLVPTQAGNPGCAAGGPQQ